MEDESPMRLVGADISPVLTTEMSTPQGTTIDFVNPATTNPDTGLTPAPQGPRTRGRAQRGRQPVGQTGNDVVQQPGELPCIRVPVHCDADDALRTGDDNGSVWTVDVAGFIPDALRKFTMTNDENHSLDHAKSRALFLASYATLTSLKQASHNLMHNMLSA